MVIALAAAVFIPMLIEARRAARNERAQRTRGGIEPPDDVYRVMQVAYPSAFVAMILEGAMRGAPPWPVIVAGATIFIAAKALKWWAILTLGPFWTFRVIVVPGTTRIASGPYAYLRHPNYAGVVGELIGIALASGALITGPIATLGFAALIARRIVVEERMLSVQSRDR